MRRFLAFLSLALLCATPLGASDSALQQLESGDALRGWEAVGRLEIDGKGFCTASLIAPDLVVTAAHCLFERQSGARIGPERIEFRAGWRNGQAATYRAVREAVVHPDYAFGSTGKAAAVGQDLALLRLHHPVRNGRMAPFATGGRIGPGARVGVVSYAHDRADAPALQESCTVIGRMQGVYATSCDVDFGSSGAPVFAFSGGQPRLVSVISGKSRIGAQDVALGVALDGALDLLMAELSAVPRRASGAKFLKP